MILSLVEAFSIKDESKSPQDSNNTSALTQERSKTVDEK
jgi:hypothetical protein